MAALLTRASAGRPGLGGAGGPLSPLWPAHCLAQCPGLCSLTGSCPVTGFTWDLPSFSPTCLLALDCRSEKPHWQTKLLSGVLHTCLGILCCRSFNCWL